MTTTVKYIPLGTNVLVRHRPRPSTGLIEVVGDASQATFLADVIALGQGVGLELSKEASS